MTICDLTQFYAACSGGIKTYLDAKREQLDRYPEIRHVLIVPGKHHERIEHGRHVTYFVKGVTIPVSPAYRFTLDVGATREILRTERPEVVELGCPYFFPWVVYSSVPRRRTAVAGFYHTHFPSAYARVVANRWWPGAGRFAEYSASRYAALVYNRCDLTFTTSAQIARDLRAYGIRHLEIARFGVDLDVFHPGKRLASHRRQLGLRDDDVLFIYAGRLDSEKCIEVLIKAFATLAGNERYHLLLIGQGPMYDQVHKAATHIPRLHLKNFVFSKCELAHWLSSADIYTTAGRWETFGFSVAEAQACGLPVVGVRQGALIERVPEHVGVLARPDDAEDFAAGLRRVAENGRARMSRAAREHAEAQYDWRRAISHLLSHYENILTQKRRFHPWTEWIDRMPHNKLPMTPKDEIFHSPDSTHFADKLKRLLPRLLIILACATLVSAIFSAATINHQTWLGLKNFPIEYLLLGVLICILPWFTHTLRLWIWTNFLKLSFSIKEIFHITIAAEVTAAAMPTIIGGGGTRVAILMAKGTAPGIAASLGVLGTLEDLAFFIMALPLAVLLAPATFSTNGGYLFSHLHELRFFQWSTQEVLLGIAAGLGIVLFIKNFAPRRWRDKTQKILGTIGGWLRQSQSTFQVLIARGKWRFALAVLLAALQWSSRYCLLGFLLWGLELAPNFLEIFVTQWVVFTIMNLFPSPGATGGAEVTFALMYQSLIPQNLLGVLGAAWRVFTFTLPVALATVVLLTMTAKKKQSSKPGDGKTKPVVDSGHEQTVLIGSLESNLA